MPNADGPVPARIPRMMSSVSDSRAPRRASVLGLLTTAAGVALLVWLIRRVGVETILAGFRQIGWGFGLVFVLGGLRFAARALAWSLCFEPPHRLAFVDAFFAVVAGDALGNATPLGPIVGEPAKAAFVRTRTAVGPALTALAIENLIYTLSAAAMIAAGMIALLFRFELPAAMRELSEAAIAAVAALFAVVVWLTWRRPAVLSRALRLFPSSSRAGDRIDRVRSVEHQIYTFASRRGVGVAPIVGAELAFHALGVLEVHVILSLMQGAPPALLSSFILETVYRLIKVAFKFIPLQVGVNEAGTALSTGLLGLGAASGLTLGIVRKAREVCWTVVGFTLLVRHGLTARAVLADRELTAPRG